MTMTRLFIAAVLVLFVGALVYLVAMRPTGQDQTGQAPPHAIEQNSQTPSTAPATPQAAPAPQSAPNPQQP